MLEHPSRFHLMRHLAGELDGEASRAVTSHVERCADCRARFDEIERLQAAGRAAAPMLPLPQPEPVRPRWTAWAGGFALAAAAALVVVALAPDDAVRRKGPDALETFCLAPGAELAKKCASGDTVAPGTRVMFHVRLDGDRHLMLLGKDTVGPVTTYFPKEGTSSRLVGADARDFMSASIALDETPGPEIFVLFVSEQPFALEAVRPAVAAPAHDLGAIRAFRVTLRKGGSQNGAPGR